jgi:hypothetical protein
MASFAFSFLRFPAVSVCLITKVCVDGGRGMGAAGSESEKMEEEREEKRRSYSFT